MTTVQWGGTGNSSVRLLATGNWQLATGNWQLATGNWQLAACYTRSGSVCIRYPPAAMAAPQTRAM